MKQLIIKITLLCFVAFNIGCKKFKTPTISTTYNESSSVEGQIEFNITTSNTETYSVDFGDGTIENAIKTTASNFIIYHNYKKNGEYQVTIIAKNSGKKTNANNLKIQVTTLPGLSFDVVYFSYNGHKHIVCDTITTRIYNGTTRVVSGSVLHYPNYTNDDDVLSLNFPINYIAPIYQTSNANPTICSINYLDASTYPVGISMFGWPPQGRSTIEITERGSNFIKGTFTGDVWTNMTKINGQNPWANIINGKFYLKY